MMVQIRSDASRVARVIVAVDADATGCDDPSPDEKSTMRARPAMSSRGSTPHERLSIEFARLSPITK